jgi:hypothetical protein
MEALKKRMIVDPEGFVKVPIPPSFGKDVEVIVLPASYGQEREEVEYFECVAEDGTLYRVKDWTDDEFNRAGIINACKDDDTKGEEIFDV